MTLVKPLACLGPYQTVGWMWELEWAHTSCNQRRSQLLYVLRTGLRDNVILSYLFVLILLAGVSGGNDQWIANRKVQTSSRRLELLFYITFSPQGSVYTPQENHIEQDELMDNFTDEDFQTTCWWLFWIVINTITCYVLAAQLDIDYLERLNPSTSDEVWMSSPCCFTMYPSY